MAAPAPSTASQNPIVSQVGSYFDQPCIDEDCNPLAWWRDNAHLYPDVPYLFLLPSIFASLPPVHQWSAYSVYSVIKDAIKKSKIVEAKSSPRDLVTETDKAVEELLIKSLSKTFPSHKFIGEESVAAGIKSQLTDDPTWIIDPVDGTLNFVHTFPYTCVSVALWVNKTAEIGIVYNPNFDQMFTARRDKGAYLNDERIKVSGQTDLSQALVFTEMGTRNDAKKMQIIFSNLQKIMSHAQGIRSMGSAALNMCNVAVGGVDAYYEIGIHAWDMAAGALLVTEAGGYICDVNGGPFDVLSRRLICASSKEIADKLVSIIEIYEEERD